MDPKEVEHIVNLIEKIKFALEEKDFVKLKNLSNETTHSSCSEQDEASITIAVMVYTLSKIIEREDYRRIPGWEKLIEKFNSTLKKAAEFLLKKQKDKYEINVVKAKEVLLSHSIDLRPYIREILQVASINKGSKMYEHGISMEKTARLLGVTQWELSDYIGQRGFDNPRQSTTIDEKKRAKIALEFFS